MRVVVRILAIVASTALPVMAAPGDQWILGIHHINELAAFTTYSAPAFPGAGYSGPQSSGDPQYVGQSYRRSGFHGEARIYWELSGNSTNSGRPVPTTTELYSLEFYGTKDGGHNGWQPIESQFRAIEGEVFPHEPLIPWAGEGETQVPGVLNNHQFIASEGKDDGAWHPIHNNGQGGPHSPSSSDYNATGYDGNYMWLRSGSWLYAKWNFGFNFDRSWSAVRLTQISDMSPPPLDGDYNGDGSVNSADYAVWRKQILPDADGQADGIIDEYDYYVWEYNFGESNLGSGGVDNWNAVPEPTALSICSMFVIAICAVRRRRGSLAIDGVTP